MTNLNPGGGETKDNVSAWTVDSSLAHLSQIINERDRRYEERFTAQEKAVHDAFLASEKAISQRMESAKEAVTKAEAAAEKRFESVNEFRGQLADQARTFLPRQEYDVQHKALEDKVEAGERSLTEKIQASAQGSQGAIARNTELIAALGIRIERAEAQKTGLKDGWGYLVGVVGFAATIISIVVVLSK